MICYGANFWNGWIRHITSISKDVFADFVFFLEGNTNHPIAWYEMIVILEFELWRILTGRLLSSTVRLFVPVVQVSSPIPLPMLCVHPNSRIETPPFLDFSLYGFFVYAACGTYVSILCKVREIDISNDGFEISK